MSVALLDQREPAFAAVTRVDIGDLDNAAQHFAGEQSSVAGLLSALGGPVSGAGATIGKDRTATAFAPAYYGAAEAITDTIRSVHAFVGGVATGLAGSATDHERADRIPREGWRDIERSVPDHTVSTTAMPASVTIAALDGYEDDQLDDCVRDVWACYDAGKMQTVKAAWNNANHALTDVKTTLTNIISSVTANNSGADIQGLGDFWKHYTEGEHSVGVGTAAFPVLYDALIAMNAALDYYTGLVDRYQQRFNDAVQTVVSQHAPPRGDEDAQTGWGILYLVEYFSGEIDQELHDAVAPVDDAMLAELQASQEFKDLTDVCVTRVRAAQRALPALQAATVEARQAGDGAPDKQKWDEPKDAVLAARISADGHAVKSVPDDSGEKRTPDSLVDGMPVEFKTIDSANPSKIFTRLKYSRRRGGQADRAALNITSNIPPQEVLRQIKRFFDEENGGVVKDVTAYCADGSKVVYPPGKGL